MLRHLAWFLIATNSSAFSEGLTSQVQAITSQQMISAGREAFLNRCSGCHGMNADGKGPASVMLSPKPRNLLTGSFKLRSTAIGVLPTIEDLLRTIEQGIPGTSMPSFYELSSREKLSLVAYVRSLRPEFAETVSSQTSLPLPPPPSDIFSTKASLVQAARRGRVLFEANCMSCHGTSGKGDGLAAETLVDNDDRPIRPADLSQRTFKSGPTVADAYRAITTGVDGSPMPSYFDVLKENQRWDIVAYIFFLRGKAAGIYNDEVKIP